MRKPREFWIDDNWKAHRFGAIDSGGFDPFIHMKVREVIEPAPVEEFPEDEAWRKLSLLAATSFGLEHRKPIMEIVRWAWARALRGRG